jgi:colicin import membrane protein
MAGNFRQQPEGGAQAGKIAILPASTRETAMRLTIVPLLISLLAMPAFAQVDSQPMSEAERQGKLDKVRGLRDESARLQKEADARLKAKNEACHKKFLVSSCLEDAQKAHIAESREAKRKDLAAGELERDVKRRDVAVKNAKRAADAPKREADQKAQGEAYQANEAKRAEERAAKQAKKEQKAAEGRRKHAEAQLKHQQKLEAQAKKEARGAEKRAAREAKAAEREARKAEKTADGAAAR